MALICNSNKDLPIKIAFYSKIPQGTDKLYGEVTTTVGALVAQMNDKGEGSAKLNLISASGSQAGLVYVDNIVIIPRPNFVDYLRSGWSINTSFSIDFTASNGDIVDADSLHHQDRTGRVQNQYEQAILGVGSII